MVDDAEFIKRRHLSRGRPRKYEPGPFGSGSQFADEGQDRQDRHLDESKAKTGPE